MSVLARDEERRHARHGTLRGGVKVRVGVRDANTSRTCHGTELGLEG